MYLTVPNWVERLPGLPAEAGRGVTWGIQCAWPWPAWTAVVLAFLAAIVVVASYLRQRGRASRRHRLLLAAVRLASVAVVMLMIGRVSLSLTRIELPCTVVLLDDSLSMTTVDDYRPAGIKGVGSLVCDDQRSASRCPPQGRSGKRLLTRLPFRDGVCCAAGP